MKKITLVFALLTLLFTATSFAETYEKIHSLYLDYNNVCNFTKSIAVQPGDKVFFHATLARGHVIKISAKMTNPNYDPKKYRNVKDKYQPKWHFLNYTNKNRSIPYNKTFKAAIRMGERTGWFEFEYKRFDIHGKNTIVFNITDKTYCNPKPEPSKQ